MSSPVCIMSCSSRSSFGFQSENIWQELYPSAIGIGPLLMMPTQSTHPNVLNDLWLSPLPPLERRASNSLVELPKSKTKEEAISNTLAKIKDARDRIKQNMTHTQCHFNLQAIHDVVQAHHSRRSNATIPSSDDDSDHPSILMF